MSKKTKTHFAEIDRANESQNFDEYGTTLCGLEFTESPISDKINEVTCKKCLKAFPKYDKYMKNIGENYSDYF